MNKKVLALLLVSDFFFYEWWEMAILHLHVKRPLSKKRRKIVVIRSTTDIWFFVWSIPLDTGNKVSSQIGIIAALWTQQPIGRGRMWAKYCHVITVSKEEAPDAWRIKTKTASRELIREVAAQWFSTRPSSGDHTPLSCRTTVTAFFPLWSSCLLLPGMSGH